MSSSPMRLKTAPQTCRNKKIQPFITPTKLSSTKSTLKQLDSKNCYEKTCCGHITRAHYTAFMLELQKEIKRLDNSISFNFNEKTVFSKVISVVHQSVEYLLLMQSKFTNMDWADLENFKSNLKLQEIKLKAEAERIKAAAKELEDYEYSITYKADQVKTDEKTIRLRQEMMKHDDLFKEELNLKCIQLEQELRIMRKKKINEGELLENSLNEIESLKAENNKLRMMILDNSRKTSTEESLTERQKLISERSKLEKEKLEVLELRSIIEKDKYRLRPQPTEHLRVSLHDSDFENSINFEEISGNFTEKANDIEARSKDLDTRELILAESEKELRSNVAQIKEQIETYNIELDLRELQIEKLLTENHELSKTLAEKQVDLKLIENSLLISKQEIENLNSEVLPTFEDYSQALSKLLAELYSKKQEVSENFLKLEGLIESIEIQEACILEEEQSIKNEFDAKMQELMKWQENLQEFEKKLSEKENGLNQIIAESITKISLELEEKLSEVRAKEAEIDKVKEGLEGEKEDNERVAMRLKVAHLELENDKNRLNERFKVKKEKVKLLKARLEEHLKLVQDKETIKMRKSYGSLDYKY